MIFRQLFDRESCTYTYLLGDEESGEAVLIDPVRENLELYLSLLGEMGPNLRYSLETHVHADHVTASGQLRAETGCQTVVAADTGPPCGDVPVDTDDAIRFGRYMLTARRTPGHTNTCVTYVLGEQGMAFTGDTLMVRGCGRTDFQAGDARALYRSVHAQIFSLPDDTLLYPGHDYKGRTVTTVGEERAFNPRLGGGRTEDQFVAIMAELKLGYPKKMHVAVPANMACGLVVEEEPDIQIPEGGWAPITRTGEGGAPEVRVSWVGPNRTELRLIDVREPHEWTDELGHVDGAELVPQGTLETACGPWDRDEPIVLICRSGVRSARAARKLEGLGFSRVASMRAGMMGWNQVGYPVVKA